MEENIRDYIESVFRASDSSGELFDALKLAISNKIEDASLYKILLANPTLSKDELTMFTEKICEDFEHCRYEIYLWAAEVFESRSGDADFIENSLYYYQKAFLTKPEEHVPLLGAFNLFNYDYEISANKNILSLINIGVATVSKKSIVYRKLSDHFKKLGDEELMVRYEMMAKHEQKRES
jgi:hypothetical protein